MRIPFKSPHLLVQPINGDFYYAINTWVAGSLKLINSTQYSILNKIDGESSIETIADSLKQDHQSVERFIRSLAGKQIVSLDREVQIWNKQLKPKTLSLWIHTTNKCNLGCSYCYISTLQTTGGMAAEVRSQLIAKLVETVKQRDLESVKLKLAGGEPLTQFQLWKDFIVEIRETFEKLECSLTLAFLTNLTILNQEIIEFSKEHDVHFGISLDGFEHYHDFTRHKHNGKGTFTSIDRHIDQLISNKARLSVSTVITQANMQGLPLLTKYLIDKKIPFRYSIVRGDLIDRAELSTHLNKAYDIMERAVENGWSFTKYHQLNDLKPFELGTQTCSSGNSGAAVYVDGGVYYCHVQFGTGLGKNGSIFDQDRDLVDLIKSGSYHEGYHSEDCGTCNYKHICTSGCPMYRVNGKDLNCGIYHEFIPRIYSLQAKERFYLLFGKQREPAH